jgi:hypothetical protein
MLSLDLAGLRGGLGLMAMFSALAGLYNGRPRPRHIFSPAPLARDCGIYSLHNNSVLSYNLPPFEGGAALLDLFPGLKPWADPAVPSGHYPRAANGERRR